MEFDGSSAIHLRGYESRRTRRLSKFVNVDVQGEMRDLKMTVNSMVPQLSTLANVEVGTQGILGGQAFVPEEGTSSFDQINPSPW
jgi:hypothetical protein